MKKRGEVEERREDPCARLGSGRSEQPCVWSGGTANERNRDYEMIF